MNLDNIPEIVRLRNQRDRAHQTISLMRASTSAHLTVMDQDEKVFDTFDLLSPHLIRGAVAMVAMQELEVIESRLRQLGVSLPAKEPEPEQTVEALTKELTATRRDLDMYRNAWERELGGNLAPKRHLIDALCVTTAQMREKAEKFSSKPTVTKVEHDRRVTELLEFNNLAEERARAAERKLKAFIAGTNAEKLALAVEQAAAVVISDIRTSQFLNQ